MCYNCGYKLDFEMPDIKKIIEKTRDETLEEAAQFIEESKFDNCNFYSNSLRALKSDFCKPKEL